jgi:hypothetical protein
VRESNNIMAFILFYFFLSTFNGVQYLLCIENMDLMTCLFEFLPTSLYVELAVEASFR